MVEIYDVGETAQGEPFLVMQLLTGESLASHLRRRGALPSAEAAAIAIDVARGVAAAHAVGVVHRDLKPANVFLHDDRLTGAVTVKVLDFGVSKVATADQVSSTVTGAAVGSPAYMSPEQARGLSSIDGRSDVWALGAMLYEMTTGKLPFEGDTPYAVVAEILYGKAPTLDVNGVHPAIAAAIARCLTRDPNDRFASCQAFAEAIAPAKDAPPSYVVEAPRERSVAFAATAPAPMRSGPDSSTSTTPFLRPETPVPLPAPPPSTKGRVPILVAAVAVVSIGLTVGAMQLLGRHESRAPKTPAVEMEEKLAEKPPKKGAASTDDVAPAVVPAIIVAAASSSSSAAIATSTSASASASVKKPALVKPPPAPVPAKSAVPTTPLSPTIHSAVPIPDSPGLIRSERGRPRELRRRSESRVRRFMTSPPAR